MGAERGDVEEAAGEDDVVEVAEPAHRVHPAAGVDPKQARRGLGGDVDGAVRRRRGAHRPAHPGGQGD